MRVPVYYNLNAMLWYEWFNWNLYISERFKVRSTGRGCEFFLFLVFSVFVSSFGELCLCVFSSVTNIRNSAAFWFVSSCAPFLPLTLPFRFCHLACLWVFLLPTLAMESLLFVFFRFSCFSFCLISKLVGLRVLVRDNTAQYWAPAFLSAVLSPPLNARVKCLYSTLPFISPV